MHFAPKPVRFLAQVIKRGLIDGDGPQREFVYATPLYVEDAHRAGESLDTLRQGTVTWFGADRGWGLITPDGDPDGVVVDASAVDATAVDGAGVPALAAGQRAEFHVTRGAAGMVATSVRVLPPPADLAASRGQPLRPGDPRRVGRYEFLRRLGQGSMGVVYLARADDGDGLVAIKVIKAEYASDPVFLRRFQSEAGHASRVRAPNVARVIAAVTNTERPYLVTEFVDGPTLEQRVTERGRLSGRSAVEVAAGIAAALAATHEAGIIHRDLAPSNVILSGTGPKVIDFGLARVAGSNTRHTQAGQPPGTPAYMSPEQISEDELTSATDIFSWAGLTVFAATGHQPFAAPDAAMSALWRQISEDDPNLGGLPGELRDVVAAAMRKDPAQRPTAEQILRSPPFAAPPRRAEPRSARLRPKRSPRRLRGCRHHHRGRCRRADRSAPFPLRSRPPEGGRGDADALKPLRVIQLRTGHGQRHCHCQCQHPCAQPARAWRRGVGDPGPHARRDLGSAPERGLQPRRKHHCRYHRKRR